MIRWGWWWWTVTRLAMLVMLAMIDGGDLSDPRYYLESLRHFGHHGWDGTMSEYPVPAVLLLMAPYAVLAAVGLDGAAPVVWALIMVAADAAVMALLLRARSDRAALLWVLGVVALGPIVYCRFDLLPGVLVALAVWWAHRRPRCAAVLAALATGLKYSPVLVLPGLAAARRTRRAVIATVVVTGAVLAGTSLLLGGPDRLFSPLRYQDDRGLQIESVWASVAMLGRAVAPHRFRVFFAPSLSWEITGPGVAAALVLTTVATVVGAVLLLWLWVRAWRAGTRPTPERLVWLTLAAVLAFIVTGKVLSPQYLAWLLPAAVVAVALLRGRERVWAQRWTLVLVVACALTHAVWPYGYHPLISDGAGTTAMTLVLVLRNLLLVGLAVTAFVRSFRLTRAADASPAA